MNDNGYVVLQSFMVDRLHLKGNELIVYAVIYGFTQDGQHWYYGTRAHLAEWCGASRGTVSNCLKSLHEKGLIKRREVERMGHVEVHYQAANPDTPLSKIGRGGAKNCDTPLSKIGSNDNKEGYSKDKTNYKGFNPPTLDEVRRHVSEKGYHFDADQFFAYYDSSGWRKANGAKVRNWKQCCTTWEAKAKPKDGGVIWDAELVGYAEGL